MQQLVVWFVQSSALNTPEEREVSTNFHLDGLLAFVDLLTTEFTPDQYVLRLRLAAPLTPWPRFPPQLTQACMTLQERMVTVSYAQMSALLQKGELLHITPAKLFLRTLKLRNWLKVEGAIFSYHSTRLRLINHAVFRPGRV